MVYRLVYRIAAQEEAANAASYIADLGSLEKALEWFDGLEAAVASLTEMPRRFGFAREHALMRGVELRQMSYKSHRVIYAVLRDELHVLHVRHTARDNLGHDEIDMPDVPDTKKPA